MGLLDSINDSRWKFAHILISEVNKRQNICAGRIRLVTRWRARYQLAVLLPKNVSSYKLKWLLIVRQKIWLRLEKKFWWGTRARGASQGLDVLLKFLFPSFSSSILTLTPVRVLEILLLFKNFKVVLKHFESLYMNGSNFSSSQHKVWVRQVC